MVLKTARIKKENIKDIRAGDDVIKVYFFKRSWEGLVNCAAVISI